MSNILPASCNLSSADNFLQTVWTQIRPDKTSGLIWIQTVSHPDGILKEFFEKVDFGKKISAEDKKNHEKLPSMGKVKI